MHYNYSSRPSRVQTDEAFFCALVLRVAGEMGANCPSSIYKGRVINPIN